MTNKTGELLATPLEELKEIHLGLIDIAVTRALGGASSVELRMHQAYLQGFLEGRAVELTREMDEHPDWWCDYPCMCHSCASYGD